MTASAAVTAEVWRRAWTFRERSMGFDAGMEPPQGGSIVYSGVEQLVTALQTVMEMFMLALKFLCWLDDAVGLNYIPDEFCTAANEY